MDNNIIDNLTEPIFLFKGVAYEGSLKEVMDAHEEAVCEQNCQIPLEQYIEEYCTPVKRASEWVSIYDDNGFFFIIDKGDIYPSPYIVATGGEGNSDKENAEKICKAVNNYEETEKVMNEAIKELNYWKSKFEKIESNYDSLLEALKFVVEKNLFNPHIIGMDTAQKAIEKTIIK